MDRICPMCQTLTYDDSITECGNCGAELPPVDEEEVVIEEQEEEVDSLDLSDLDLDDDSEDVSTGLEGLDLDLGEEEEITEETAPATEDVEEPEIEEEAEDISEDGEEDAGDWDLGTIGGDSPDESFSVDEEEEEEEEEAIDEDEIDDGEELVDEEESDDGDVEEIIIEENQLLCPSCDEINNTDSESCSNCGYELGHSKRCPSCAKGIDKTAEICPNCYTDLATFKPDEPEEDEEEIIEEDGTEEDEEDTPTDDDPEEEVEVSEDEEGVDDLDEVEDTPEDGTEEDTKEKKSSRWGKKSKKKKGDPQEDVDDDTSDIDDESLDADERSEEMKKDKLNAKIRDRRKKDEIDQILEEEKREGFFNYYNMSLITLFFYVFLAIFVLVEFIMMVTNMVSDTGIPTVSFSLVPTYGDVSSISILLFAMLLSMSSALLHLWDRKLNLMLSLIPSTLMAVGLGMDVVYSSLFLGGDLIVIIIMLFLLLMMIFLDFFLIFFKYPEVLEDNSRDELELFLEKEEELEEIQQQLEEEHEKMIQEEEEKLRLKDEEINEIKTELESLSDQIQMEEEKLRMKEEEVSAIRSELELKTQHMAEEEEKLRMKEEEMESLIQTELEKRADDMMMEEEEKLRMKEEELIHSRSELDIQKNLLDDSREKLRMKEQEMMNLRTELESQMRHRMDEEDKLKLKEAANKMLDRGKQKRVLFPFTAMVGQEKMKSALTLNAIYPEIGGVLIRGQKGTGKSVSVRGLSEILPDIEVTGCKFNCDPKEEDKFCTECAARHKAGNLRVETRQVQVVDLPLNVTEDRLVGSIDIEKVLTEGVKSFEPGILAEAHRGVLYVDEINLLDDYIVDILLDAAGSGVVTIEREGISLSHPSRFLIVGSMNPEEGELRPQILDRIALQTDVVGIKDVAKRIDIVRRREEFSTEPLVFREKFEPSRKELVDKIERASGLISKVTTPERIFKLIAQVCMDFNVDGHRADIIIERAARANAAFEGRMETATEDVVVAASMALPHRMKRRAFEDDEEFSEEMLRRLVDKREAELE